MEVRERKLIQAGALLGCLIIVTQMAIIAVRGEALCLNEGCRVVGKLTTIPPFFFNLAGLIYFFALLVTARWFTSQPHPALAWPHLLLLAGLAAEGVLVSYQLFVAQTLCSYCLVIASLIMLLNLLCGWRQILVAAPIFLAVLGVFPVLNFGPTLVALRNQTLASGSFAVKRCAEPSKQLYLFFSSDCPHCKNVIKTLESCNSCEFHFNPVEPLKSLGLEELEYFTSYEPAMNRLILSLLGIETVPVLLVLNPDGLTFIKGEESIIRYISKACFREKPLLYMNSSKYAPDGISIYDEQEGNCTMQVECSDAAKPQQTPAEK